MGRKFTAMGKKNSAMGKKFTPTEQKNTRMGRKFTATGKKNTRMGKKMRASMIGILILKQQKYLLNATWLP